MNYLYLIRTLFNYELYLKYRSHIKVEQKDKEIFYMFKALDAMMDKFQHTITYEDYALWVQVNLGSDYNLFLNLIKETTADEDVLEEALQTLREKSLSYELAQLSLSVSEGKATVADILEFIPKFEASREQEKTAVFVTTSLGELYNEVHKHQGLRWRLGSLNRSLGSLRKGDFGFIFARPETGKTTLFASEASYFAEQLKEGDGPGIWFNNEEQHKKVMLRIIQASLGVPINDLIKDLDHYQELYREKTGDRLLIPDMHSFNKRDVEAICREYKPSFVIIDQLPKVKGFHNDRHDLQLGSTFEWARDLAAEYCPVIGASQSDGSGENKRYLTMENVANSKTAVQAEADFILGVGKIHDAGFEKIRFINISKNKLFGDEDSVPEARHGKFEVLIQPELARYRDI